MPSRSLFTSPAAAIYEQPVDITCKGWCSKKEVLSVKYSAGSQVNFGNCVPDGLCFSLASKFFSHHIKRINSYDSVINLPCNRLSLQSFRCSWTAILLPRRFWFRNRVTARFKLNYFSVIYSMSGYGTIYSFSRHYCYFFFSDKIQVIPSLEFDVRFN